MTTKTSERVTLLAAIDPISSATVVSSGWVDVSDVPDLLAIVQVGLIAATGTLNAKLEQATTSGGAGAKDVTGKAITQLADTADNRQILINCSAEELDVNGGFDFVRLTITPATAASLIAGVLLGINVRYGPKTHNASVTQTVN